MTDTELASARQSIDRICQQWARFIDSRQRHLAGAATGQAPAEKVAENILCELFTGVLDWKVEQVRLQDMRADMTLTRGGLRYLIVEVKRPGSFDGRGSITAALRQATEYARTLQVDKVAVSDGCIFEAYDLVADGARQRVAVHLSDQNPPENLWWLSTRGIYRTPTAQGRLTNAELADDGLFHPKYGLPARCFAHVGDPQRTASWKLPYLLADGSVDAKRLPKAIGAVIRDYRSEQVQGLTDEQTSDALVRLACAAARTGRMPHQDPTPADIYVALYDQLRQLGRLGDVPGLPS